MEQEGLEQIEQATAWLGSVVAVSGSQITGAVANDAASNGELQIGALVKMSTASSDVFGLVTGLRTRHGRVPEEDRRAVDIQLVGEIIFGGRSGAGLCFQRGVSVYPALSTPIIAANEEELALVYARPESETVEVGSIFQNRDLGAYVMIDEMLGKHFAVLGTTGSGKSCTVALLLRSILEEHPNGHTVLIDPHGEYSQAFGNMAETISPADLELPYWLLNFAETASIMVSHNSGTAANETSILKDALLEARIKFIGDESLSRHITVDTISPYRIVDLVRSIDNHLGMLDKPDGAAPYLRLKARIESLRIDQRLKFMFPDHVVRDNLAAILARLLRIPVCGKPVAIIDIAGLPCEIVDVAVSVLCRMIFDFALWSDRDRLQPMLLVCEEAHRYAPQDAELGFQPTRDALARIAKEGRKYGISLCLVSQRPSELSTTILAQCNTLFALRMSNERDHEFVRNALPDAAHGLLAALPTLRTQEAIAVGEGVPLPMRLRFHDLPPEHRPRSATAAFSSAWRNDSEEGLVEETVLRWRHQHKKAARPLADPPARDRDDDF